MQLLSVVSSNDLDRFCMSPDLPNLALDAISVQDADAHLMVSDAHDRIIARCSLWWRATPNLAGQLVGYIGHYAVRNREAGDQAAATMLLDYVCQELAERDCTIAIGPLDGNTFRVYRFVTQYTFEGTVRSPFFLEPNNPAAWPQQFAAAGFVEYAHYYSAQTRLNGEDPRRAQLAKSNEHIRLRPFNLAEYALEIDRIYEIVCRSFTQNLLYQPIPRSEFIALYAPLQGIIQPELVWIAEHNDRPLGFIFALPDLAQRARGETIDTVILKTVAVVPEASGTGLGSLLVATCQDTAWRMGFRTAIHALMYEDNISRKISNHYAGLMRKYTLFTRSLSTA